MFLKLNSPNQHYSAVLTLLLASTSLFTAISPVQSEESKEQHKQFGNALEIPNSRDRVLLAHHLSSTSSRVLPATLDLVKHYEGFRSRAYIDTSGLPVIGYGQSRINGQTVRMGQYITRAQADAALARELYHIQRLVLNNVKVELTPHQLGALTSLVYNAGTRVIKQSTLSRKLNAGDYQGAAREFTRWNKANQGGRLVALPGLTKRRAAEKNLFLTPYPTVSSNSDAVQQ